jgi:hypothetical protein
MLPGNLVCPQPSFCSAELRGAGAGEGGLTQGGTESGPGVVLDGFPAPVAGLRPLAYGSYVVLRVLDSAR